MSKTYTSNCLCKAVSFEITGPPAMCVVCHCSMCRRSTGAPYTHVAAFPSANVKLIGDEDALQTYNSSEGLERRRCAKCGANVLHVIAAHKLSAIPLGTMNGAFENNTYIDDFKPACHLFYADRVVDVKDGAPKMKQKTPEHGVMDE